MKFFRTPVSRGVVLWALVAGCAVLPARAQLASVRGTVLDAGSGEPLVGATVSLATPGQSRGEVTGEDGRFEMARIAPGAYQLAVRFVGFAEYVDTLHVEFGRSLDLEILLRPDEAQLEEVVVEEERRDTRSGAGLSGIRLTDLARVPMPDVSRDLAAYLVTIPGIVALGDRGGQLFVRGGTPTQNLVLVDGIPIYQPFHIVGFYSAFPADIVAWADVYAGGFPSRYGGRISSVIDIGTRNGDKRQVRAFGSVAPFLSSLRVEVPVAKDKVSMVISARESLIERISPGLLGYELPFRFGDRFVKLHAFLSQTSSLSVTGLQTWDEGDLSSNGVSQNPPGSPVELDSPSSWKNAALGYRYTYLPPDYPVIAQFAMYVSRLDSKYRPAGARRQDASVAGYTMEYDLTYLYSIGRARFGLFGTLHRFQYDLDNGRGLNQSGVTSGGVYVDTRFEIGRFLVIEPGGRFESFSRGVESSIDPRLRASLKLFGGRQEWSAAWGTYHQQFIGLNNEQDLSDVFTVWAATPRDFAVPAATHLIFGVRNRPTSWLEILVEAFSKDQQNIAFPVFVTDPAERDGFSRVDGDARGVDTRIDVARRRWNASLGYSLAKVEYEWVDLQNRTAIIPGMRPVQVPTGLKFHPPHDRRHQVQAMFQVVSSATRVALRWLYGSGFPFTQVNGFWNSYPVRAENPDAFRSAAGSLRISRSHPSGARLPAYHRLDLSIERDFSLAGAKATVQAGLMNVYDRSNLFQYNFVTGERIDQLPLVPSIGLSVGWP